MKKQSKERSVSLLDRVHAGEFDNPIVQVKTPAEHIIEQQIDSLLSRAEILMRMRELLPSTSPDPEWVKIEKSRKIRFRMAIEDTFKTKDHPKADELWNRAWEMGGGEVSIENAYVLYVSLLPLIK